MKTLYIGADPFPPYQYINESGEVCGLDYEIVKSTVDKMGYQANYIIGDWSSIEDKFNKKEIDIVFQVQKTLEREKKYYFSNKLRDAITSIATSKDDSENYDRIDDIVNGKGKIGVIENYQYGEIIDSIDASNKEYYKSLEELLESINSNRAEFGVVDLGVFNFLNKDNYYKKIKIIEKLNFNRPLYVAFNDIQLRDEFNTYLGEYFIK